ncbi:MAG: thrombospondin type 3 repeat-containing protein, partial [Candidatus Heimdallarchaeota archaeon]
MKKSFQNILFVFFTFFLLFVLTSNNLINLKTKNTWDEQGKILTGKRSTVLENWQSIDGISLQDITISSNVYAGNWTTIKTGKNILALSEAISDFDNDNLPEIWSTTSNGYKLPQRETPGELICYEFNTTTNDFTDVIYNETVSSNKNVMPIDIFHNGTIHFIVGEPRIYPTQDYNYYVIFNGTTLIQQSDTFRTWTIYDYVGYDFEMDSLYDIILDYGYYSTTWSHQNLDSSGNITDSTTTKDRTSSGVYVADMTGDGNNELVICSYSGRIFIYQYNSTENSFNHIQTIAAPLGPGYSWAWDFDLNGIPNLMRVIEESGEITVTSYEWNNQSKIFEYTGDSITITGQRTGGLFISEGFDLFGDGNQEFLLRTSDGSKRQFGYITYNGTGFQYHKIIEDPFTSGSIYCDPIQIDNDPEFELIFSYSNTTDNDIIYYQLLDYKNSIPPLNIWTQDFNVDVFSGEGVFTWTRTDSSVSVNTANGVVEIASDGGNDDGFIVDIPDTAKIVDIRAKLISNGNNYKYPNVMLLDSSDLLVYKASYISYLSSTCEGWYVNSTATYDYTGPNTENVYWDLRYLINDNNITLFAKNVKTTEWRLIGIWKLSGTPSKINIQQPFDAPCEIDYIKVWYNGTTLDFDGDSLSDAYEQTIGTNPYDPDTDDDKFTDGEEDSSGTDPLDRYDNVNITSPVIWYEPFNSEIIWDDPNWYRTGTYYSIDETNEWLHKATAGTYDDRVLYNKTLTYPFQIEMRGRLVSGGQGYTTPGLVFFFENGSSKNIKAGKGATTDWFLLSHLFTDVYGPSGENEWWSMKAIIDSNFQALFVKSDFDSEWHSIGSTFQILDNNIVQFGAYASWDAIIDVDYIKISQADSLDSDSDGLSDSYENSIGTDPNDPDTDDDKFTDGEEDSSGTDPLDRYDNINITSPVIWYEPFNSEIIWDDPNWYRTGTYYAIDESNEWLHKGSAGTTDDEVKYLISLSYPFEIEFRGRNAGSSDGTTPGFSLYLENGTTYYLLGTQYDDWRFFGTWYYDLGYYPNENEWCSIKIKVYNRTQQLFAKKDSDSSWVSLISSSFNLNSNVAAVGFYASLDDIMDIDYLKISILTSGLDSDSDGLTDEYEISIGTDPNNSDSDNDGLNDGEEVFYGADGYITDPLDADSDDDGLLDGQEHSYNTNPNLSDTDDDGLNDYEETVSGADGYITDPLDADSDDDGLLDGQEHSYNTNPNLSDTDDDGL